MFIYIYEFVGFFVDKYFTHMNRFEPDKTSLTTILFTVVNKLEEN